MTKAYGILAGMSLLCGSNGPAPGERVVAGRLVPFARASVHLEQNATDRDMEVVFDVDGGKDGLAELAVVSPDGRTILEFTAPGASPLGIRQFRLETPEPKDVARLKATYPEGMYTFAGATAAGDRLQARAKLAHELPDPVSQIRPGVAGGAMKAEPLEITWKTTGDPAGFIVAIEQEELGTELTARLPGSAHRLIVPDGFLNPGMGYRLAIGTVAGGGNVSFVETTFTTAGAKAGGGE
jgi:hypothetical protein